MIKSKLHIYPQHFPHGDAYLVMNQAASDKLFDCLNEHLFERKTTAHLTFVTADGEQFKLFLVVKEDFDDLLLPYTEEEYQPSDTSDQISPFELIDIMYYREAHKERE